MSRTYYKQKKKDEELENAQPAEEESKVEDQPVVERADEETASASASEGSDATDTGFRRPTYEKVTYDPPSDEEIERRAEQELYDYRNQSLKDIDAQADQAVESGREAKEDAAESKTERQREAETAYAQAKKRVEEDMLRRGIARSSMAGLLTAQNESGRAQTVARISQEYAQTIAKLDEQIAEAEQKRLKAIADFNVGYAVKYAQKVESLKQEREEKAAEASKYNNSLAGQAFDDEVKAQETESELKTDALNQKLKEEQLKKEYGATPQADADKRIYDIFRAQLSKMSPAEAYEAIRNDAIYADNLTTSYYLRLLDEFGREA